MPDAEDVCDDPCWNLPDAEDLNDIRDVNALLRLISSRIGNREDPLALQLDPVADSLVERVFRTLQEFTAEHGEASALVDEVDIKLTAYALARLLTIARDYRVSGSQYSTLAKSIGLLYGRLAERRGQRRQVRTVIHPTLRRAVFTPVWSRFPRAVRIRKNLSPKREIELFRRRCENALADGCNGLLATRAEYELSFYCQDLLARHAGRYPFPDFAIVARDGRLVADRDELLAAVSVARHALDEDRSLNSRTPLYAHDVVTEHIQLAAAVFANRRVGGATVSQVDSSFAVGRITKRSGVVHSLVKELGELVGLQLVTDADDKRMRKYGEGRSFRSKAGSAKNKKASLK
ncbi:hypothetical protein [Hyphomicrobium sp. LHD-15]|uniref:hypothetical protein n=1 Tax=Hyphomicrobium sp. LHD-15 TaxID=3072142 RepID=UPI00280CF9C8|nr:hypothetical protein [Hyphomicrobium sp. LHD-15]MDQ8700583.1 hypothetical protein [Hyphomicrobium sp. LHD-15]